MRKLLLTVLSACVCFGISAQTSTPAKSKKVKTATWKRGGVVSLTLSQGGTRNWAPGGDRFTLASNGFLNLYANHTKGRMHWDNMLDVNYGLLNSNSQGIIKNDDKLDLVSKLGWTIGNKETSRFSLGTWMNFRTQLADGFDYDGDLPKRISAFFAPAIPTISAGVGYQSKNGALSFHVGPHARWVIVANRPYELAANYGIDPARQVRIEAGGMASVSLNKEIIKNVTLRSRLDAFSDGINSHPGNVDVFFTNMFYLKVNKCLGLVYNFDLQYDDDTKIFGLRKSSPGTQLKSIMGLGLSVKF